MTNEPDLSWIVTAEAWDLERRMDEVALALATNNKTAKPNLGLAAALNVLAKAANNESNADALAPAQAKALVSAALVTVRKSAGELTAVDGIIQRLSNRPEYASMKPLAELAHQIADDAAGNPPNELRASEAPDLVSHANAVDEWTVERDQTLVDIRAGRDVDFLRVYASRRLPASFAEALHVDNEVWSAPAFREWVATLDKPFDPDVIGIASSALLNARLRHLRPRLFLRSPQSLVVQAIASTEGREQLEAEFRRDLGRTTATMIHRIKEALETETDRKGIRKTELKTLIRSLGGVFQRLQFEERPARDEVVAFDPVMHDADADDIQIEERVIVRSSGLSDVVTKEVLSKPMVTRIRKPESAPEHSRTTDTPSEVSDGKAGHS